MKIQLLEGRRVLATAKKDRLVGAVKNFWEKCGSSKLFVTDDQPQVFVILFSMKRCILPF
jgi:hypothetical protein